MLKPAGRILILGVLASAMAACGTAPRVTPSDVSSDGDAVVVAQDGQGNIVSSDSDSATSGYVAGGEFAREEIFDNNSPLATRVVYFDYDQATLRPEYLDVINNHARYLSSYPDVRVRLEGHTDERGTREYNIALGERRAQSVARLFSLEGVAGGQVTTVSLGEEQPVETGFDDESRSLNRRVEIIYEGL